MVICIQCDDFQESSSYKPKKFKKQDKVHIQQTVLLTKKCQNNYSWSIYKGSKLLSSAILIYTVSHFWQKCFHYLFLYKVKLPQLIHWYTAKWTQHMHYSPQHIFALKNQLWYKHGSSTDWHSQSLKVTKSQRRHNCINVKYNDYLSSLD